MTVMELNDLVKAIEEKFRRERCRHGLLPLQVVAVLLPGR